MRYCNKKSIDKVSKQIETSIAGLEKIKFKDTTSKWHIREAIKNLESSLKYLYYASIK